MNTLGKGRFLVSRELGRGPHTVVYLGDDRQLSQAVVIKVFHNLSINFKSLADLKTDVLIPSYDYGFDAEQHCNYSVREAFPGSPLLIGPSSINFTKLIELITSICQALHDLHDQGLFHGSLRPNNILWAEGKIKLVDFAVNTHFNKEYQLDRINYLAPEVLLGKAMDGSSDFYSLGVLLYELVSGRTPFQQTSLAGLTEQLLFESPTNPVPEGSSIPREFGHFVLRLLAKDPSDRFADVQDVIRSLNIRLKINISLVANKRSSPPEGSVEKSIGLFDQAIAFYEGKNDPEAMRFLTEIYYRQGKWTALAKLLESSATPLELSVAILQLQLALKNGEFASAQLQAQHLLAQEPTLSQRGVLTHLIGTALYHQDDREAAWTAFGQAERYFTEANDLIARAFLLNSLGHLKIREGQWDEARQCYEESVLLCRKRGDTLNEGLFLTSLGHAYHQKDRYAEALSYYQVSEDLLEAIGYQTGLAKVKSNLANLFITTSQLDQGEEKLRQSEQIAQHKGDFYTAAYAQLLYGDLLRRRENLMDALMAYQKAQELFAQRGYHREAAMAMQNIDEIHKIAEEATMRPSQESETESLNLPFLRRTLAINRRLSVLSDVQEILELLMDSVVELTGAERGFLTFNNESRAVRNLAGFEADPASVGFANSLVERVTRSGEPLVSQDTLNDERFFLSLSIHKVQLRMVVCLPFRLNDQVVGVLYLDNRLQPGACSESNIEWLQALVDQAAIIITRTAAWRQLVEQAEQIKGAYQLEQEAKQQVERLNEGLTRQLMQLQDSLKQTVVQMTQTHQELEVAKQELGKTNQTLLEELQGAQSEVERLNQTALQMAHSHQELEVSKQELGQTNQTLQEELQTAQLEVKQLSQSIAQMAHLHQELEVSKQELGQTNETLEEQLRGSLSEVANLTEQRTQTLAEMTQLTQNNTEMSQSNKKLQEAQQEFEQEISRLKDRCQAQEVELGQLTQNLLDLKQNINDSRRLSGSIVSDKSLRESLSIFECELLRQTLDECQGNISQAAKHLQVARPQLSRLVKKYQLKEQKFSENLA